jgi:hypothetical protein
MKVLGRTINSPITLLPLDTFQRHLLAGTAGLLVWVVTSVWNWGEDFEGRRGWNWPWESTMIEGIVYHLDRAVYDLLRLFEDPGKEWSGQWYDVVRDLLRTILDMLPTAISLAILVSSCLILLGAFKIITYPDRLRRLAPAILGVAVTLILIVQLFAYPANSITALMFPEYPSAPPTIRFIVFIWVDDIIRTAADLAVPIAVLLLSLLPVFAPEKKDLKRSR